MYLHTCLCVCVCVCVGRWVNVCACVRVLLSEFSYIQLRNQSNDMGTFFRCETMWDFSVNTKTNHYSAICWQKNEENCTSLAVCKTTTWLKPRLNKIVCIRKRNGFQLNFAKILTQPLIKVHQAPLSVSQLITPAVSLYRLATYIKPCVAIGENCLSILFVRKAHSAWRKVSIFLDWGLPKW